jgi:hypothetical protein
MAAAATYNKRPRDVAPLCRGTPRSGMLQRCASEGRPLVRYFGLLGIPVPPGPTRFPTGVARRFLPREPCRCVAATVSEMQCLAMS